MMLQPMKRFEHSTGLVQNFQGFRAKVRSSEGGRSAYPRLSKGCSTLLASCIAPQVVLSNTTFTVRLQVSGLDLAGQLSILCVAM